MALPTMVTHPAVNVFRRAAAQPFMGWGAVAQSNINAEEPTLLKVTNLVADVNEPNSFLWALNQNYPRIIVFEVGGVIDLGWNNFPSLAGYYELKNPYVWVAGQTAPSPGITIIRGMFSINTHDVIVQHIAVRPGADPLNPTNNQRYASLVAGDGNGNVVIDHCSLCWTISPVAGIRDSVDGVTYSNCIISEAFLNATQNPYWASRGLMYNITGGPTRIAGIKNLMSYNQHRNPLINAGASIAINNYVVAWDHTCMNRWNANSAGYGSIVGNYAVYGDYEGMGDTRGISYAYRGMFNHSGDYNFYGYFDDNLHYESDRTTPIAIYANNSGYEGEIILTDREVWHESLNNNILAAIDVPTELSKEGQTGVGARPWDRDVIDKRIVTDANNMAGGVVFYGAPVWEAKNYIAGDIVVYEYEGVSYPYYCHQNTTSNQPPTDANYWHSITQQYSLWDESWYPSHVQTNHNFIENDWNLDTMTPKSGVYPGEES
jgi:hypothetical protein